MPDHIEQAVVSLAVENPALGQQRASNTLQQQGIIVSSSGVRSIWIRNDLETFKKRLKALEAKSAAEGILLTEAQLQCLEKAQDEKEAGLRALLNLGHTFGHAIEAEMGYGNWLHGEAVAAGMVQASQVAMNRQWLTEQEVNRIEQLLSYFDLPTAGPTDMNCEQYLVHMKEDKKVQADTIRFVLPKQLGQAILVKDVTESELNQVL